MFDLDAIEEPATYPPPLLVSVIKNGSLAPEDAFPFYGITGSRGIDRALSTVMAAPQIASRPFGYLRISGYRDVEMQFVDVVSGLEEALLHEDEDENGAIVSSLPAIVLATCPLSRWHEQQVIGWAQLNGVGYIALDGERPYCLVLPKRAQA